MARLFSEFCGKLLQQDDETMVLKSKKKQLLIVVCSGIVISMLVLCLIFSRLLSFLGECLVFDDTPIPSDGVVVLNTGLEYYPRLIEAADLYNKGLVKKIILNGNRKTNTIRELEKKGFEPCCHWCEDRLKILYLYGIPKDSVLCISAENVYDTISEARAVGPELAKIGIKTIIVTTSKFHTRRAHHIWKKLFGDQMSVLTVSAKTDPFKPHGWWKHGRQVRWVLAEYGAWLYYYWKINRGDAVNSFL